MKVCLPCRREMECVKNGAILHYGNGHCYAVDGFRCPGCDQVFLTGASKPFKMDCDQLRVYKAKYPEWLVEMGAGVLDWRGQRLHVEFGRYESAEGPIAMKLVASDGSLWCKATVNIPEAELPEGHVLIKDWSENKGVLEALQKAGIVGRSLEQVPTGHVFADRCELRIPID